jgi:hypothetical protein
MLEVIFHSILAWYFVFIIAFVIAMQTIHIQNARAQHRQTYKYLGMKLYAPDGSASKAFKVHRSFFPKSPIRKLSVLFGSLGLTFAIVGLILNHIY